eukprot:g4904.t1
MHTTQVPQTKLNPQQLSADLFCFYAEHDGVFFTSDMMLGIFAQYHQYVLRRDVKALHTGDCCHDKHVRVSSHPAMGFGAAALCHNAVKDEYTYTQLFAFVGFPSGEKNRSYRGAMAAIFDLLEQRVGVSCRENTGVVSFDGTLAMNDQTVAEVYKPLPPGQQVKIPSRLRKMKPTRQGGAAAAEESSDSSSSDTSDSEAPPELQKQHAETLAKYQPPLLCTDLAHVERLTTRNKIFITGKSVTVSARD